MQTLLMFNAIIFAIIATGIYDWRTFAPANLIARLD